MAISHMYPRPHSDNDYMGPIKWSVKSVYCCRLSHALSLIDLIAELLRRRLTLRWESAPSMHVVQGNKIPFKPRIFVAHRILNGAVRLWCDVSRSLLSAVHILQTMKTSTTLAFTIFLSTGRVLGWGASGHQAVGYIAMPFLAPKALSFVKSSLGATYNESLGPAATWADEVKSSAAYKWSANLHFVDAQDNPPTSCSVDEQRDCSDGVCILNALANYTSRIVDPSLDSTQTQEALKFIDHFIGDIGQPLHVEAVALGGNTITATCAGSKTNLHSVWDSGIINRLLLSTYGNSVTTWANALVARLRTGEYNSLVGNWISCSSTTEPLISRRSIGDDIAAIQRRDDVVPLQCPIVWSRDSNTFDCSFVFNFTTGQDLCDSTYYTEAIPIIESQIAKQGIRLAAWLNMLFDGEPLTPSSGIPTSF